MNRLELTKKDYTGSPSTLCKGCGHDSITTALVSSLYELSIDPREVIKISGIGCSSKTPNYFLDQSFGFNSIHGRMASLATGIHLSQPQAKIIGISGDGDTASIGLGGFLHLVRRNVPLLYIIANNGVYGLTKGQFSATSQPGDLTKSKSTQSLPNLDMAYQALAAGCGFVARAFSGDQKQLKSILSLGLLHKGTAVVDIVSPCVAYGNHDQFSKSYTKTQENNIPLHEIDLIELQKESISSDLKFKLKNLSKHSHDPTDFASALAVLNAERFSQNTLHTGLLYKNEERPVFNDAMAFSQKNKFEAQDNDLRLSESAFESINEELSL